LFIPSRESFAIHSISKFLARSAIKFHLFKERFDLPFADQQGINSINIEKTPKCPIQHDFPLFS
ncbi:MAG TPA: hypothetical protein VK589_30960, partial [Chryseolinea sp.]|nr:hypothetical protein [Chryseolinea sp.]